MTEEAKKIVDALKHCADIDSECFGCVYENDCSNACPNDYAAKIKSDAADLIERLSAELEQLKRECEKQVPKKPRETRSCLMCAVCGRKITEKGCKKLDRNYCKHCGQAIDWSENSGGDEDD